MEATAEDCYVLAAKYLLNADIILIGAGAGMGVGTFLVNLLICTCETISDV
jgi:hypothetical protein